VTSSRNRSSSEVFYGFPLFSAIYFFVFSPKSNQLASDFAALRICMGNARRWDERLFSLNVLPRGVF
jgi:hypothetical protein